MPSPIEAEEGFNRSASRQLASYGVIAVIAFVLLMFALDFAAGITSTDAGGIAGAVDVERNEVTAYIRQDPPQLNTTGAADQISGIVLGHVMEGLLRYDAFGGVEPGLADRWEMDGERIVYHLRDNARWSNGQPITAHDFEFAWKTTLDPATASQYAFILYAIKNAAAANAGEVPLQDVGVRALNERELEVILEQPIAYFNKMLPFTTFSPINEAFYHSTNGRYGAEAESLLYSGPFIMTSWVHGASLRLEKNPYYWDRDSVKLNAVNFAYVTEDTNTLLNLFKDGRIVQVDLTAEMLEGAMQQRWILNRFMDGSVFFIDFNHRPGRLTGNLALRKAMLLVSDANELVDRVIKLPGYMPAKSLFPVWMRGVERSLHEEYPPPLAQVDFARAREYLEQAKQELGISEFPPLVLLADTSPVATISAQYYQQVFRKHLGLDIVIDQQIFGQRLAKMELGDFDIVLSGWGPDYNDPLTFGDYYASWNLNNRGRYVNPRIDELVRIGQFSLDPKERMDAFGEIQQILFDQAILIGNYERGKLYATDPRVKGIQRRQIGAETDYTRAYIDPTVPY